MNPNLTTSVPFGYELVIEYISGNFALHAGDHWPGHTSKLP